MAWGESARGGSSSPPARPPLRASGVGIKVGEYRAGGDGGGVGAATARAEAVERRGLRRRGEPVVPAGVHTPAVSSGSGASAVLDGMEGGRTGGGRGGRGRRGAPAVRAGIG